MSLKANNLFGIKAYTNWTGRRISLSTTEWYNGKKVIINADFRAYDSFDDSIEDHSKLLVNQRYDEVRECSDYKTACYRIYKCGYATDPKYAEKLIKIIEQNMLYELDDGKTQYEVAADQNDQKILKFQQLCNQLGIKDYEGEPLKEDNVLGPRTRNCIGKMPLLRTGSEGPAVKFVQELVMAEPVDDFYGPITQYCVKQYQISKGIQADGIVGLQTWEYLIST